MFSSTSARKHKLLFCLKKIGTRHSDQFSIVLGYPWISIMFCDMRFHGRDLHRQLRRRSCAGSMPRHVMTWNRVYILGRFWVGFPAILMAAFYVDIIAFLCSQMTLPAYSRSTPHNPRAATDVAGVNPGIRNPKWFVTVRGTPQRSHQLAFNQRIQKFKGPQFTLTIPSMFFERDFAGQEILDQPTRREMLEFNLSGAFLGIYALFTTDIK